MARHIVANRECPADKAVRLRVAAPLIAYRLKMVAHLRRHPVDDLLREFFFAGKQLFLGESEALVHATSVDQSLDRLCQRFPHKRIDLRTKPRLEAALEMQPRFEGRVQRPWA